MPSFKRFMDGRTRRSQFKFSKQMYIQCTVKFNPIQAIPVMLYHFTNRKSFRATSSSSKVQ